MPRFIVALAATAAALGVAQAAASFSPDHLGASSAPSASPKQRARLVVMIGSQDAGLSLAVGPASAEPVVISVS